MNDQTILQDFCGGQLGYLDAIEALQKIGIDALEAERMVNECAEAMEIDNGQFGVGA